MPRMEMPPDEAMALAAAAHKRLLSTASGVNDDIARSPSRLPGWTVAHVLTHLARNAEGHTRRLEAALEGRELPRYPGGEQQRNAEIDSGAKRSAAALLRDLNKTNRDLEAMWERSRDARWPHADLLAGDSFATSGSPLRRLREVEVHHVDLGLGYEPSNWPDEYVVWELPNTLARVTSRLQRPEDAALLLAWVGGGGGGADQLQLKPWM